jgi:hypothetical protein
MEQLFKSPINIIVFSKDRALQLELFLRSFRRFVKGYYNYVISILYTYSNDKFKEGYDILLESAYPCERFVKETNFKQDTIDLIDYQKPYTVFFVDDIIFKEPFEFFDEKMRIFINNKDIACLSLRLHKNLDYCYAEARSMAKPVFDKDNVFNWTRETGDYGYPMSQDGHIFRTEEIYGFHVNLEYHAPNTLEGRLHLQRRKMPPLMICYDKSKIINNPLNRVQFASENRCGNISAEFLNDKFLKGYVIDLEPFVGFDNIAVHTEITPNLIKA